MQLVRSYNIHHHHYRLLIIINHYWYLLIIEKIRRVLVKHGQKIHPTQRAWPQRLWSKTSHATTLQASRKGLSQGHKKLHKKKTLKKTKMLRIRIVFWYLRLDSSSMDHIYIYMYIYIDIYIVMHLGTNDFQTEPGPRYSRTKRGMSLCLGIRYVSYH